MGEHVAPGSDDREPLDRPAAWPAIATLVVVVVVWLVAPRMLPTVIGQGNDATFAAVEALFSGLAFAGVVWTVLLQSRELALQRAELIATREEMARAREESARTASAQEDAARLAALVALIGHESARLARLYPEAFAEARHKTGEVEYIVKDQRAAADYKESLGAHFRYLDDLKEAYARIARPRPDSAALGNTDAGSLDQG